LTKKSIDLNRNWNQWFKSHWFKSANPDIIINIIVLLSPSSSLSLYDDYKQPNVEPTSMFSKITNLTMSTAAYGTGNKWQ